VVTPVEEWERLTRRDRRVLAADLPEAWIEAVRKAEVPDAHARLDVELK
jgi:hypothetical protein